MSEKQRTDAESNANLELEIEKDKDRGQKRVAGVLNSIDDFITGLEKVFDFSKQHNSGTRFLNIMGITGFNILWLIGVLSFLVSIIGYNTNQLIDLLNPLYLSNIQNMLPQTFGRSPAFLFFFSCIIAPLWEEIIFRLLPLKAILLAPEKYKNGMLGVVAISASIIFGYLHFGPISILIQGIGGALYCWLYLRNKSILSPMIAHAIWNFTVIFGLPTLIH